MPEKANFAQNRNRHFATIPNASRCHPSASEIQGFQGAFPPNGDPLGHQTASCGHQSHAVARCLFVQETEDFFSVLHKNWCYFPVLAISSLMSLFMDPCFDLCPHSQRMMSWSVLVLSFKEIRAVCSASYFACALICDSDVIPQPAISPPSNASVLLYRCAPI